MKFIDKILGKGKKLRENNIKFAEYPYTKSFKELCKEANEIGEYVRGLGRYM